MPWADPAALAAFDRRLALVVLAPAVLFAVGRSLAFAARSLSRESRPWDEEMARRGESFLLAQPLRQWFAYVVRPLVSGLGRVASPDALTLLCLALSVLAAALLAMGLLATGAAVALLAASLDYFDGKVARQFGIGTTAGNFLDSTLDRWSEVALFVGAAVLLRAAPVALAACVLAQGASLIVSYARAKAESLDVPLRGGLMQRPERLVLFCVGGLVSPFADLVLAPQLGPMAVFRGVMVVLGIATAATAASRTIGGYRALRSRSARPADAADSRAGRRQA
jgi:CDP-diacylglycerol--glycerol-3-phosphate 3-phosphatidyltransferase